jgi:hypothetical protein
VLAIVTSYNKILCLQPDEVCRKLPFVAAQSSLGTSSWWGTAKSALKNKKAAKMVFLFLTYLESTKHSKIASKSGQKSSISFAKRAESELNCSDSACFLA